MVPDNQLKIMNTGLRFRVRVVAMLFACGLTTCSCMAAAPEQEEPEIQTPRQLYNKGTQKLQEGKLREAESFLQSAVSGQNEKVQGSALYNLGHVRFKTGLEEL